MKFKLFIDRERCKGCMLCISSCAKKILKMSRKLNSRGFHYPELEDADKCVGCKMCAEICPDAAIEIEGETVDGDKKTTKSSSKSSGKTKK
jgi:2-oxoglutarate ferredoxin oxidoreductase subunit delta